MPHAYRARSKQRHRAASANSNGRLRSASAPSAAPSGGDCQQIRGVPLADSRGPSYYWPVMVPPPARDERDYDCAHSLIGLAEQLASQRASTRAPGPLVIARTSDEPDELLGPPPEAAVARARYRLNAQLMAMIIGTEKMVDRQPKDSRHRLRQQALLEESLREAEARLATLEERFEAKRRSWLDADAAFNRSLLDAEAAFREELRAIENGWRPLQGAAVSRDGRRSSDNPAASSHRRQYSVEE